MSTSTEVRELTPGGELDALVAEKIWDIGPDGWPKDEAAWKWWGIDDDGVRYPRLPQFSTEIAAAWEVIERLLLLHSADSADRWYVRVWNGYPLRGNFWIAVIHDAGECNKFVAAANSAPEAICLAALKAVEV